MMRNCVCGKTITLNSRLCSECAEIYGLEPNEWPEWLRWMLSDIQRDVQYEHTHNDHVSIETGVTYDSFGNMKAKPKFALRGCRTESHLYEDRHNH